MNRDSSQADRIDKTNRQTDLATITLKNQLGTVRQLLEFCEDIDVAPLGVSRKLRLPTVGLEDQVSNVHITVTEADVILDYCNKYKYATRRHVTLYIL